MPWLPGDLATLDPLDDPVGAADDLAAFIRVDDEPLTASAYASALARAAGHRPWFRGPGRLLRLLGHRTTSLTRWIRASNDLLEAATAWTPTFPSVREGWAATVTELQPRRRDRRQGRSKHSS